MLHLHNWFGLVIGVFAQQPLQQQLAPEDPLQRQCGVQSRDQDPERVWLHVHAGACARIQRQEHGWLGRFTIRVLQ